MIWKQFRHDFHIKLIIVRGIVCIENKQMKEQKSETNNGKEMARLRSCKSVEGSAMHEG